jgi:hypothetical protein
MVVFSIVIEEFSLLASSISDFCTLVDKLW